MLLFLFFADSVIGLVVLHKDPDAESFQAHYYELSYKETLKFAALAKDYSK